MASDSETLAIRQIKSCGLSYSQIGAICGVTKQAVGAWTRANNPVQPDHMLRYRLRDDPRVAIPLADWTTLAPRVAPPTAVALPPAAPAPPPAPLAVPPAPPPLPPPHVPAAPSSDYLDLYNAPEYVPADYALDGPGAARRSFVALLELARRKRHRAEHDGDAGTLIKWMQQEAKLQADLARLVGELSAVDESKLAQTASWQALRQRLLEAVAPYPDAARAVAAALGASQVAQ